MFKTNFFQQNITSIEEENLANLDNKIDLDDLTADGTLISNEESIKINNWFTANSNSTYQKFSKFKVVILETSTGQKEKFVVYYSNKHYPSSANPNCKIHTNCYKEKKYLGKGCFAKVKLMQSIATGKYYALKNYKLNSTNLANYYDQKLKIISNEVPALTKLNLYKGKNELKINLHSNTNNKNKTHYDTLFFLGMELLPGISLANFIDNNTATPISHLLLISYNLCSEVIHLINNNILHNDLKPDNILIHPLTYQIKITDYQFSLKGPVAYSTQHVGAMGYAPFELLSSNDAKFFHYDENMQLNPLGIIIAELFKNTELSYSIGNKIYATTQRLRVAPANKWLTNFTNKNPEDLIPEDKEKNNLLESIAHFCLQMTDDDKDKRPSLKQSQTFFAEKYLQEKPTDRLRLIFLLDLNEYLGDSNHDLTELTKQLKSISQIQNTFHVILQKADEVWLIDHNKQYQTTDYLYALRKLQQFDVPVSRLFHNKISENTTNCYCLLSQLPSYIKCNSSPINFDHIYLFPTTKILPHDLQENLRRCAVHYLHVTNNQCNEHYINEVKKILKSQSYIDNNDDSMILSSH